MSHARLSPSSRHRWGVCPGSIREESKYPEEPSGPAAIDGTHSHTLLEWSINNKLADPNLMVGKELTDHEGTFTVDAERAERVKVAVDYLLLRVLELGITVEQIISEEKVDPYQLTGRTDLTGTVDCHIATDNFVEVIDYKDGMAIVEAENNPQMLQYLVGILSKRGESLIPAMKVRLTIIQPKLRAKGMTGISTWDFNSASLQTEVIKLMRQAKATDDPDAPLVPGAEQCKYCRAKGCSARASAALEASGISFDNLTMAKQAADKTPTEMTDAQIKELLEAAPLIRQVIEAAEAEALRRFEAGQSIEGLKVVRGRGSRSWAFNEAEMAEKLKKMGLPKDTIWKTSLISPAQVEKATWTKRDGTQVRLTERQLKTLNGEYIKKSEGKLTVVSASDDRQAVTLSAAPLFSAVTEPDLPDWLK